MESTARWPIFTSWIVLILLAYQAMIMKARIERLEIDSVRAQRLFGVILMWCLVPRRAGNALCSARLGIAMGLPHGSTSPLAGVRHATVWGTG